MAFLFGTSSARARCGTILKLGAAVLIACTVLVVAGREPRRADALFHFAVIDEVQFGRGADPSLQFVEIRMLAGGQNLVSNSRLSAWNADGSFFGVILLVPTNEPNATSGGRWIMASTGFAAASGMTPDFTFPPVALPATGMLCWGAPGVIPPDPPVWDPAVPTNYVDCVPYGGYTNANIRFGPATPFGLGDGLNSLTRLSDTDNTAADFGLVCPSPRNAANGYGYHHDENWIDLPPTKAFDDFTWPNSDTVGDECGDTDDDNDGLLDTDELGLPSPGCPSATGPTNPLRRDTDGDRILDRAECGLGTNPNVINAAPAGCAVAGDADLDGVTDSREFCYYGTSSLSTNTDGDGCGDGREIASVNGDLTVSATDLSQVAQHFGPAAGPLYLVAFDITKDGNINATDLSQIAQRFGPCP